MSNLFFDIPLRANSTEYKYGDLLSPNEVYSTPYAVTLANMRLSLANLFAFADFSSAGKLTGHIGGKLVIRNATPKSYYPPAQNSTHVKATTHYADVLYDPDLTTNPLKSLVGSWELNSWATSSPVITNQRFNIDLGEEKEIDLIYYENGHDQGAYTDAGAKDFDFQGSNNASAFSDTDFDHNAGWTDIATGLQFDQHSTDASPGVADPKFISVPRTKFRYFSLKIKNNWGYGSTISIRRIELQNHRSASGYIKAAGTGETSTAIRSDACSIDGTADWSKNIGTLVFSTDHYNMAHSAAGAQMYFPNGAFDLYPGCLNKLYKLSIEFKNGTASGQTVQFGVALSSGIFRHNKTIITTETSTTHTIYYVADGTERYIGICVPSNLGGNNIQIKNVQLTEVLLPSVTGVTIVSTPGGTVQSWESIEEGFNPSDPAGFTAQIYHNGHVYRCTIPGVSGSTPPSWNASTGSTTTDGAVVWTECTPSGITFLGPCRFTCQPKYGDYRRNKKYAQPISRSAGGDVYVYDKGLSAQNDRELTFAEMLPGELDRLLDFIEIVRGAAYDFLFYDEDEVVHRVMILNPNEISSAPVSHNFEGGITVKLLFI